MELDLNWTFTQYRAYELGRAEQSAREQDEARTSGLVSDPKTAPHGGYRVACTWPTTVTAPAHELSAGLAALLPGTPAYPQDSIQSSVANLSPPEPRLVDPASRPEDRAVLDRLSDATETVVKALPTGAASLEASFAPAYLAARMAYVFARPELGYWALHRALHAAYAAADLTVPTSWGPHLTLTRFGRPASPALAAQAIELLSAWRPVSAVPTSVTVGYYTVSYDCFRVTPYRSFLLR